MNAPEAMGKMPGVLAREHDRILDRIFSLYQELFFHDGYGNLRVEMRFLKKGQKEILVICGKEYRFVVDYVDYNDDQTKLT